MSVSDQVAAMVDQLRAPTYREHLALARPPGAICKSTAASENHDRRKSIVAKVRTVQSRIGVPFLLENISYAFEWPNSNLSDAVLNLICRESGAGLIRHRKLIPEFPKSRFRPYEFLDNLSPGLVKEVRMAGGIALCDLVCNGLSRRHPLPPDAGRDLDLLQYALSLYAPQTIILERDDRLRRHGRNGRQR